MAGLSCGTLGMGTKQTPSLPFDLCPQGDQAETYHALESFLQGGDSGLRSNAETRLRAKVPGGCRAAQVSWFSWRPPKQPSSAPGFGEIRSSAEMFLRHPGLTRASQCPHERSCSQEAPPHRAKAISSHPVLGTAAPRGVSRRTGSSAWCLWHRNDELKPHGRGWPVQSLHVPQPFSPGVFNAGTFSGCDG